MVMSLLALQARQRDMGGVSGGGAISLPTPERSEERDTPQGTL